MDLLECGVCKDTFTGIIQFLLHKANHTVESSKHVCQFCEQQFFRLGPLIEHYSRRHQIVTLNADNPLSQKHKPRTYRVSYAPEAEDRTLICDNDTVKVMKFKNINESCQTPSDPCTLRQRLRNLFGDMANGQHDFKSGSNTVNTLNDAKAVSDTCENQNANGILIAVKLENQPGLKVLPSVHYQSEYEDLTSSHTLKTKQKTIYSKNDNLHINQIHDNGEMTDEDIERNGDIIDSAFSDTKNEDNIDKQHMMSNTSCSMVIDKVSGVEHSAEDISDVVNENQMAEYSGNIGVPVDSEYKMYTSTNTNDEAVVNDFQVKSENLDRHVDSGRNQIYASQNDKTVNHSCKSSFSTTCICNSSSNVDCEHQATHSMQGQDTSNKPYVSIANSENPSHQQTIAPLNPLAGLHNLSHSDVYGLPSEKSSRSIRLTPITYQKSELIRLNPDDTDDLVMCQVNEKVVVFRKPKSERLTTHKDLSQPGYDNAADTTDDNNDGKKSDNDDATLNSGNNDNGKKMDSDDGKQINNDDGMKMVNTGHQLVSAEKKVDGQVIVKVETGVLTQSKTVPRQLKTILTELNMPDFYFIFSQKSINEQNQNDKHISEALTSSKGKSEFICILCAESFNWQRTLCSHMRAKHVTDLKSGKALLMPINKSLFSKGVLLLMSSYIEMAATLRQKRIRAVERQDLPGRFPCNDCDKVFYRLRNLRKHKACHSKGGNQFLCTVCVKTFKTSSYLRQHMKIHNKQKMFKCTECDFTSDVNIAIHDHRQIHPNNSIVCEICGSAYNDRSTLKKHMRVHDPARPFACKYPGCTLRFLTEAMCNGHFQGHTESPKFECRLCGYKFKRKHHLHRHQKVVHNIDTELINMSTKHYARKVKSYSKELSSASDYLTKDNFVPEHQDDLVIDENGDTNIVTNEEHYEMNVDANVHNSMQASHLVITSDECSMNTMNYEMSDMGTSIVYHTLLHDEAGNQLDTQTILLPEGRQVLYQQDNMPGTVHAEVEINHMEEIHL